MLFATSVSSPGGEPSMKEETMAVDILDVVGVLRLARSSEEGFGREVGLIEHRVTTRTLRSFCRATSCGFRGLEQEI
ncbi:hypothetical protein ES702_00505 [subsurface metagenome]